MVDNFFPAIFLVILAFSINLLGDWMRDTLNPRLKNELLKNSKFKC